MNIEGTVGFLYRELVTMALGRYNLPGASGVGTALPASGGSVQH